ncbi:MAG: DNA cytosine methyltransferase [Candidatus Thiodiazotropha endolucinida]|nr:DNA cytosine methyltransferase [Candidatus Thiodiazotropha taylori]MCW4323239.1 DNA cytosine methyltransferase [Candidatus Thiodiazotropha taylori]
MVENRTKKMPGIDFVSDRSVSCIDLFCGVGGLTHGFKLEGLKVNAGLDLDPACKYPYETNNETRFVQHDVSDKSSDKVVAELFTEGSIKILAGCAPCQPFSTYRQGVDSQGDERWRLLYAFARMIKKVQPEVVTMENVPSIQKHKVFHDFVRRLKRSRYKVWSDVVECSQYGVPQTRNRLVLLASKYGDIELISPTHYKPRTVKQVIGRLKGVGEGESAPWDRLHVAAGLSKKNLERIKASMPGGTWRDWPQRLVADCHKQESGRTYSSVYGRMKWDEPAPTITTQCYGFGNGRFGHPEQDRAITLREAAMLQGFPRGYKFVPKEKPVEFRPIGRMIGNAVPVDLGRAIAKSIKVHLEEFEELPPS